MAEGPRLPDRSLLEEEAILRARAADLARPPVPAPLEADLLRVVRFSVGREIWGIETRWVREVLRVRDLVPIPCTPAWVMGVVSVRGAPLSVLDLRVLFDLPSPGLTDLTRVVVLESAAMDFGLLADAVLGTAAVVRADLGADLATLQGQRADYLMGITSEGLVVLDGGRLLASEALVVNEHVD